MKKDNSKKDVGNMSSEALLSTSACGASLSIKEEKMVGYTKSKDCENERS